MIHVQQFAILHRFALRRLLIAVGNAELFLSKGAKMPLFTGLSKSPPADSLVFTESSSEALTRTNSPSRWQDLAIWCVGAVARRRRQQQMATSRAFDVLVDMN